MRKESYPSRHAGTPQYHGWGEDVGTRGRRTENRESTLPSTYHMVKLLVFCPSQAESKGLPQPSRRAVVICFMERD